MTPHFILYVDSQAASRDFYREVLGAEPRLDVPGMTEFALGGAVLGLMPRAGIEALIAVRTADPQQAKAELYLRVDDPEAVHARALRAGATELSPLRLRDWGDEASYVLDLDGHVLAFARPLP